MQTPHTFNNKVDIWGLGCIAYEILTRKKAFESDWETIQYALRGGEPPLATPDLETNTNWPYVGPLVLAMLDLESWRRPSASAVLKLLTTERFFFDHAIMEQNPITKDWKVHRSPERFNVGGLMTGWLAYWFSVFKSSYM